MNLDFPLPVAADDAELPAAELAQLIALFAEQQAASATAHVQAALGDGVEAAQDAPLAPADGAFNTGMAARLIAWKEE